MPRKSKGPFLRWRKDRNVFEIIHHTGGKRIVHSTGTSDSAIAQKALSDYIIGQPSRRVGPCHPHERSVADVLNEYLTHHASHLNSAQREAHSAEALLKYFGRLTVGDVKKETINGYIAQRGVKVGTVIRELSTLSSAINFDYKSGNLLHPVHVWKPKAPPGKERILTRGEAAKLLWEVRKSDHLQLFILMGLYTVARSEALLSLRWPQVDLEKGLIDFNPPGRVRTSKGRPIIPIPSRLMPFLRYARQRGTELGYVIHINQRPIKRIIKGFRAACKRLGLEDVTPHTLRHTGISWMVQNGVSIYEVSKYAGHKNIKTTIDKYAHHSPEFLKGAAESFKRRGK